MLTQSTQQRTQRGQKLLAKHFLIASPHPLSSIVWFVVIGCLLSLIGQPSVVAATAPASRAPASGLSQSQAPTQTQTISQTVTATVGASDLNLTATPGNPAEVISSTQVTALGASQPFTQGVAPNPVLWSKPVRISALGQWAGSPGIAADSTGMIHAIWSEREPTEELAAEGSVLMYARFDGQRWTQPQDVLTSLQYGGAEAVQLVYTPNGLLHAVWGTGGAGSQLMYARASACCADKATNWSKPIALGLPMNLGPAFTTDHLGRLHVAFADSDSSNISYFRSDDSGTTWTVRREVQGKVRVGGEIPAFPSIAVDHQGRVHLVWSTYPWPGRFVLYARSDDGGENWTDPQIIDRFDSNEYFSDAYGPILISVATTTSPDGVDRVHLIWDGAPTVERNYIYSEDGGKTWSQRYLVFPEITKVGRAGFNPIQIDSAGTLHSTAFEYHSMWLGSGWQPVSTIFNTESSAEQQVSVMSLGNQLNVIWQDKQPDAAIPATVSYAYGVTAAPRRAPRPLPEVPRELLLTQPVPPGVVPALFNAPTPTRRVPTPAPTLPAVNPDPTRLDRNPMTSSMIGVASIAVFLTVVLVVTFSRLRFRRRI